MATISCGVKIYNVPDMVLTGACGSYIVARFTESDRKWWFYSAFKDGDRAHRCAIEVDGFVFNLGGIND